MVGSPRSVTVVGTRGDFLRRLGNLLVLQGAGSGALRDGLGVILAYLEDADHRLSLSHGAVPPYL